LAQEDLRIKTKRKRNEFNILNQYKLSTKQASLQVEKTFFPILGLTTQKKPSHSKREERENTRNKTVIYRANKRIRQDTRPALDAGKHQLWNPISRKPLLESSKENNNC